MLCMLCMLAPTVFAVGQSRRPPNVHFLVIECSGHSRRGFNPSLALRALNRPFPNETPARLLFRQEGIAEVSSYVPPGTWVAYVTTGNGCGDILDLTVIPGAARSLTVATRVGMPLYNDHGSVVGRLPLAGLRLAAGVCERAPCSTATSFTDYPAVVEGKSYYVNYLPAGKWILRIWFANTLEPGLSLALNESTKLNTSAPHLIRNITMNDLMELLQRPH